MKYIRFCERWNDLCNKKQLNAYFYPVGRNIPEACLFIDTVTPFLLEEIGNKKINLYVRGSSGAILGALLAKSVKNQVCIHYIKKKGEERHGTDLMGRFDSPEECNVIIDDFICTGSTLKYIYEAIAPHINKVDVLIVSNGFSTPCFTPDVIISDGTMQHAVSIMQMEIEEKEKKQKELDLITF